MTVLARELTRQLRDAGDLDIATPDLNTAVTYASLLSQLSLSDSVRSWQRRGCRRRWGYHHAFGITRIFVYSVSPSFRTSFFLLHVLSYLPRTLSFFFFFLCWTPVANPRRTPLHTPTHAILHGSRAGCPPGPHPRRAHRSQGAMEGRLRGLRCCIRGRQRRENAAYADWGVR